jgi:hypothetical protein
MYKNKKNKKYDTSPLLCATCVHPNNMLECFFLYAGVIEKRRQGEPRISRSEVGEGDDYMSPESLTVSHARREHAATTLASNRSSMDVPSWRSPVLDKVKVKGGESRAQRAESESRRRKTGRNSFNEPNGLIPEDLASNPNEDSGTENTPLLD